MTGKREGGGGGRGGRRDKRCLTAALVPSDGGEDGGLMGQGSRGGVGEEGCQHLAAGT